MTSYKKLKEENKRLKEDIAKIINNDVETIARYRFKKSLEDLSTFGNPTSDDNAGFEGIIPMIRKHGNTITYKPNEKYETNPIR